MPPKAKPDTAAYQKLKKDIKEGTIGTLYVFHGEEAYLRDFYLGQLKKKLLPAGMEEFNLHTLSGKEFDVKTLAQLVDCLPMMSERTLIVVNDYDIYKGDKDALAAVLRELPDYVCLVFVYDLIEYKADARTKLAALLKEKGSVVPFNRQGQGDLVDWISRRFKAMDHDIGTEDAKYLIFLCGDLMNNLISEIGKIGSYAAHHRVTRQDIDAVAVTYAPGLIGALLVGVSFAKSVAYGLGVPLIPVHHVRGHIAANYIAHPDLEPPFLCLCVSGGTTALVDVQDYTHFAVLGSTRDDAAGECFDKTARVLGLGYPGGGPMDKMAQGGNDKAFTFPKAHVADHPLDMSFSGLKTAVLNTIHNAQQKGDKLDLHDLAASFAAAVSDSLVPRVMAAARAKGYGQVAVAGGVAANRRIRADLQAACARSGARLYLPELKYCGDNAAMIGCQGFYEYQAGHTAGMELNAYANRDISLG